MSNARLYIFGWPADVGGASTKLAHLLRLLHRRFPIVLVPNEEDEIDDPDREKYLAGLDVEAIPFSKLPDRLEGWGLCMCNFEFLLSAKWAEVRSRGLKMAWSNEMMWTHPGELGVIFAGLVDQVLYVSNAQRECLEPEFRRVWTGSLQPASILHRSLTGEILPGAGGRPLRWTITGNYIDPALFPMREQPRREDEPIVVGRLSRPDPAKFPEDFPAFYEGLGLRNPRFRVMAWSDQVGQKWAGHPFDHRWDRLPAMKEDPAEFLRSLDLFVYSLGSGLRESWGRAIVEAMLSGAVPILPDSPEHHLRNLIVHGDSGFLCQSPNEFGHYARLLEADRTLLWRCSRSAREHAVNQLCAAAEHLRYWETAFPEL